MSIGSPVKLSQGGQANRSGRTIENTICSILDAKGYLYSRQVNIGKTVYGHDLKVDVLINPSTLFPSGLIVESKWQDCAGSVDEKFPYLVLNIKEYMPYPAIVIYGGGGARAGAVAWLRRQVGGNLLAVLSFEEFLSWSTRNL
jgi:hypothetical protein